MNDGQIVCFKNLLNHYWTSSITVPNRWDHIKIYSGSHALIVVCVQMQPYDCYCAHDTLWFISLKNFIKYKTVCDVHFSDQRVSSALNDSIGNGNKLSNTTDIFIARYTKRKWHTRSIIVRGNRVLMCFCVILACN